MKSIDFLKEKLIKIHESCNYLDIQYEFRNYINTHIIKVEPKDFFESDNTYVKEQISLENEFENLYPYEDILFVSENELIKIECPILELKSLEINDYNVVFSDPFNDISFFNELIMESTEFHSIEEIGFVGKATNQYIIPKDIPPKKSSWLLKKKKSSKVKLELFFV